MKSEHLLKRVNYLRTLLIKLVETGLSEEGERIASTIESTLELLENDLLAK